jgi:D-alanine-D-alanine ligase
LHTTEFVLIKYFPNALGQIVFFQMKFSSFVTKNQKKQKLFRMKNIAIVCGGYSGEYEISIATAETVKNNLDTGKYTAFVVVIEKSKWFFKDENSKEYLLDRTDFSIPLEDETIRFDGVFNAIHGTPGEDGKLLAYFDMLGIPYTSCEVDTSALTFNKFHSSLLASSLGVNVAKSVSLVKGGEINRQEIVERLGLPLFVKRARSGSSFGISKVFSYDDFDKAVEEAFNADDRIIFEEFLEGREFGCGLFMDGNQLKVLPLTEIISKKEFFDYEAKYTGGMADEITPPHNLAIEAETDIKTISAMIYRKLNCKGILRLDFILTESELYLVEINTVPGLSPNSIVPRQAKAMGISLKEMFTAVIEGMF